MDANNVPFYAALLGINRLFVTMLIIAFVFEGRAL